MNNLRSSISYKDAACKCVVSQKFGSLNVAPVDLFVLSPNRDKDPISYILDSKKHAELLYGGASKSNTISRGSHTDGILAQLILLSKSSSLESYTRFFERNGFFFPLDPVNHTVVNANDIIHLVKRISAIYELHGIINTSFKILKDKKEGYRKILNNLILLLYSPPITLPLIDSRTQKERRICPLKFTEFLFDPDFDYPSISKQKYHDADYFEVEDAFFKTDRIKTTFYNAILQGEPVPEIKNSDDVYFRQLVAMHCSTEVPCKVKKIADFFYHFQIENGVLTSTDTEPVPRVKEFRLSEKMLEQLSVIAQAVICEEISYYISSAQPSIEPQVKESFQDNETIIWKTDSLMQAIHIAIMHDYVNGFIYAKCKYSKCKRPYFPKSINNIKKEYCCTRCDNQDQSAKSKARKKQESEDTPNNQ